MQHYKEELSNTKAWSECTPASAAKHGDSPSQSYLMFTPPEKAEVVPMEGEEDLCLDVHSDQHSHFE
jgi:hypothetical protein